MMDEQQQLPDAADPVADVLKAVPTSDRVRAAAWDAFHAAKGKDDLATRLKDLPLPNEVKAALWDAKPEMNFATVKDLSQLKQQEGPVERFVEGAVRANPITNGLDMAYQAVTDPKAAGKAIVEPSVERIERAKTAYHEGRPLDALGNVAAAVPMIGPYVGGAVDRMREGDVAGGLGELSWLGAPAAKKGAAAVGRGAVRAGRALVPGTMDAIADNLDRSATEGAAKFMSPQVGPNKTRLGNQAVKIAPKLLRDPELGAVTRRGFAEKVRTRYQQSGEALDAASDARMASQQVRTGPILRQLDAEIGKLTASPVEADRAIPSMTGEAVRQVPVNPLRQYALRWMQDEMESFPFTKHTWSDAPRLTGNAGGGHLNKVSGSGGAPIYHEITMTFDNPPTRGEVSKAIGEVMSGQNTSRLHQAVLAVADQLAREDRHVKGQMWTPGPDGFDPPAAHTLEVGADKPASSEPQPQGRPFGQAVEPKPHASQIATLRQIRHEVAQLGEVAPYESVRRIRAAWDDVAKAKYLPSTAADAMTSRGDTAGAERGTAAMREALAQTDPTTAAANAQYHVYKAAHDVVQAAEEADRVRPNRGRGIMARTAGAVIGAKDGAVGAAIGAMTAAIVDKLAEQAPSMQLAYARRLAGVADALRAGDVPRAQVMTERIVRQFPAVKTGLRLVGKGAVNLGRSANIPASLAAQEHEQDQKPPVTAGR